MKKLILLLAAGFLVESVYAQVATSSMVRLQANLMDRTASKGLRSQQLPESISPVRSVTTVNKGTGDHTRTFNYVDYLGKLNPDLFTDANYHMLPYMWFRPDIYGVYLDGAALVSDTISLSSYGMVMHPTWSGFGDPNAYNPGTMTINSTNSYTLDSVRIYGAYGRNVAKPNIVDTLRIAVTYGNGSNSNIGLGYYTGMASRYLLDTVKTAILDFDDQKHSMMQPAGSTGPSIIYKDIYLHASDTGKGYYAVAPSMTVPAGNNLVAVTVTFKSGETYTPFHDTAFVGSVDPSTPFRFGMFRPVFFIQNLSAFPTYYEGSYNSGQFKTLPDNGVIEYGPTWGWYANDRTGGIVPSSYQFPYMDFVISCAGCKGLSVPVTPVVMVGNAFPNPANGKITLPVKVKEAATVNIVMTDLIGRIIEERHLGRFNANQQINPEFDTRNLSNGVYLLTVEANGARYTNRFMVAN